MRFQSVADDFLCDISFSVSAQMYFLQTACKQTNCRLSVLQLKNPFPATGFAEDLPFRFHTLFIHSLCLYYAFAGKEGGSTVCLLQASSFGGLWPAPGGIYRPFAAPTGRPLAGLLRPF
jgi:hypothetical protein